MQAILIVVAACFAAPARAGSDWPGAATAASVGFVLEQSGSACRTRLRGISPKGQAAVELIQSINDRNVLSRRIGTLRVTRPQNGISQAQIDAAIAALEREKSALEAKILESKGRARGLGLDPEDLLKDLIPGKDYERRCAPGRQAPY